jgi:two-component system response regulator HydG
MHKILVIDDDKDICALLARFLEKNRYKVQTCSNGSEGIKEVKSNDYDLILCDYRLPDITGIELLQKIKLLSPSISVIIITGYSDVKTAVATLRHGASDYVTKPIYPDELLVTIKETIEKAKEKKDVKKNSRTRKETGDWSSSFIIGKSPQSLAVQRHIELIGPSDISVIVHGETGTGKEFVAQSIHRFSKRAESPFVAIDCGVLSRDLAGSELFGHIKGSFTGAIADKPGSFELADGGTIFLDEIGNLSYENQMKLLRVIQERTIKRVGATQDIPIDVRIIAASNENLARLVQDGRFRNDLFHRLNEFSIQLDPLRYRKEDIMYFADFFLKKANEALNKNVRDFAEEVKKYMLAYFWHGNLRELNNVVKRAVLLTPGELIEMSSLPIEIMQGESIAEGIQKEDIGLLKSVAWTAERQAIVDALAKSNNNKSKASKLLNIDRKTLYNKLRLFNIKSTP